MKGDRRRVDRRRVDRRRGVRKEESQSQSQSQSKSYAKKRIPEESINIGGHLLVYDRDSRRGRDLTGRLRNSAEKGINLYNELHCTAYDVADLIRVTSTPSAGYVLYTTFTAKLPDDEISNALIFKSVLCHGIDAKEEVLSVCILDAPPTELTELIKTVESVSILDGPPTAPVTACCTR